MEANVVPEEIHGGFSLVIESPQAIGLVVLKPTTLLHLIEFFMHTRPGHIYVAGLTDASGLEEVHSDKGTRIEMPSSATRSRLWSISA